MSERGSFVTQYIHCDKCFNAVKEIFLADKEGLLQCYIIKDRPIIAGKIGGSYNKQKLNNFEKIYKTKISKVICHPIRVAVLEEDGEDFFVIEPNRKIVTVKLARFDWNPKDYDDNKLLVKILCLLKRDARLKHGHNIKNEQFSQKNPVNDPLLMTTIFQLSYNIK